MSVLRTGQILRTGQMQFASYLRYFPASLQ